MADHISSVTIHVHHRIRVECELKGTLVLGSYRTGTLSGVGKNGFQ